MAEIEKFDVLGDYRIWFQFTDGLKKVIDFKPYIKGDPITRPLADLNYFNKAQLYERGAGLYWPNGYDFDPTYLRDHAKGETMARV